MSVLNEIKSAVDVMADAQEDFRKDARAHLDAMQD
jgi:hypothetical protein